VIFTNITGAALGLFIGTIATSLAQFVAGVICYFIAKFLLFNVLRLN